ncbi:MAG: copper transporter [Actinomyces sp.]|uniref:copper transporter n=1 Tax=Actinomyces sp. TaxID=29317 RepID=UPI0026DB2FA1|nr:copper transporter [Actinomyces sp.]MDO4244176.1 copper transporter [Actinomyces sp.]
MIDFRYHLVSLISVFLALAVGVVLGAGPLQNSLGTALNDQVATLRADRNATQTQLEQTEAAVHERDGYITAAADSLLPGTLTDKKVAVVLMPEVDGSDVDTVVEMLEKSGAAVTGRVTLTTAWVDLSRESFRVTYSGQFSGYLATTRSTEADAILGEGLATALTSDTADASTLMDLLTASDTPLVTVDAEPTGAADMIVVIGPRTATASQATAEATPSQDPTAWATALAGTASVSPTVVVGSADQDNDVVALLRSARAQVTTVDSVGQSTAAVSTPLALASTAAGTIGAYGFNDGADAVIPAAG